ncbi:MAG TPA: MaoC family dehydratase [Acidimicrobiales bacterium]|nr:MaoC family dehydratase [Acidimicrobiales bacterium]
MASNAEKALEQMQASVGHDPGPGEWFTIDQPLIDTFADVTHDHQFIHVDPERAKATPFGSTIAHGFLTLSLVTHLSASVPRTEGGGAMEGLMMGVNYGFDKVRFVSPVKVGSRIRARSVVSDVRLKDPSTVQVTRTVTVEIENESRPACVAEWLTLMVFA